MYAVFGAYAHQEALAIRRLVERPWEGKKAVSSLPSLIDMIRRGRKSVTREAFVTRGGVPYDPAPYERSYTEHVSKLPRNPVEGTGGLGTFINQPAPATFGLPDFGRSRRRHDQFDQLSGALPETRQPGDQISEGFLNLLSSHLKPKSGPGNDPIRTLAEVADKFAAHAATPKSREAVAQRGHTIPFKVVMAAHRKILAVGSLLTDLLCDDVYPILPAPYVTELNFLLDEPMPECDATRLRSLWALLPSWYAGQIAQEKAKLKECLLLLAPPPYRR